MTFNYINFWESNYRDHGTSGAGSYGLLAEFKAEVINALIREFQVKKVLEFGCGDGNQLQYMNYPEYLGLDIAPTAIRLCAEKFSADKTKSFLLYRPGSFYNRGFYQADLCVCLDVLYHITDEPDFQQTLQDIMESSTNLVVLYTKITTGNTPQIVETIRDRDIFQYLSAYPDYELKQIIPQRYPNLSSAEFIILQKQV